MLTGGRGSGLDLKESQGYYMCRTRCQEASGDEEGLIHVLEKSEHFVRSRRWCSVRVVLWVLWEAGEGGKEQTCAFSADESDCCCNTHERCWGCSEGLVLRPGVWSHHNDSNATDASVDAGEVGPLLDSVVYWQVGAVADAVPAAAFVGECEAAESGTDSQRMGRRIADLCQLVTKLGRWVLRDMV